MRIVSRTMLITALLFMMAVNHLPAAFTAGDEIQLTRDEPLYFNGQLFRNAKQGEKLTVYFHRAEAKQLFVLTNDKTGRQISLSVKEDAVVLVPMDVAKVLQQASAAAKLGRLDEALRSVDQALQRQRGNNSLLQTKEAIEAAKAAALHANQASITQKKAKAEAQRLWNNAKVVDRPDAFNRGDTSNQRRASQMREEANLMEKQAEQAAQSVNTATNSYKGALTSLERAITQALAETETSAPQRNSADTDPKQSAAVITAVSPVRPEMNQGVTEQPPSASFGASETQCRDVYGTPSREVPALAPATKAAVHSHDGFDLVIGYFDGKATYFSYTKGNEPMGSTEIDSLLKNHHGNSDWKRVAGTSSPIDGRWLDEWTRKDGKARSELLHIDKRSILIIYGEGY